MKKKSLFKFVLDFGMILVLVLMYNKRSINMTFHELGGLILIGVMLIHVAMNYRWVIGITKKLFSRALPVKTRIGYAINALLLITFLLIGMSGIFISKTLFHLNVGGGQWKTIHYTASAIALILIGIHLGLHRQFLGTILGKLLPVPQKMRQMLGIILSVVIIGFGCYSMVTTSFSRWMLLPFTAAQMEGGPNKEFGDNDHNSQINATQENGKDLTQKNENKTDFPDGKVRPDHGTMKNESGFPREEQTSGLALVFLTIAQFFSITYVFAVFTALLDILMTKRKRKKLAQITADIDEKRS